MNTLILLNGPPRCGKDTIADCLVETLYTDDNQTYHKKIAQPLKDATHAAYGFSVSHDHFENVKDEPNDGFFGLTPRQAYINMSELLLKPSHGNDIVGRMFIKNLNIPGKHTLVISDCGFLTELKPIIGHYKRVLLIRLHRDGTNFDKDSRSYIHVEDDAVLEVDIDNNSTIENATSDILNILRVL